MLKNNYIHSPVLFFG